ncbi:MAG: hypothetical protein K9N48_04600, partial [Verrucomicrobia bacterium]|nr:hypothetical protein [Verrucomicrobiota bacterium]
NVPVVRCTNNGLTCWIDARGRIKYIFKDESGGPHGRGFDKVTVGYTKRGNGEQRTFYNLHGDLFAYICLAPASFPVLLWLADVLKRLLNRRDKKLNNAP